ncbi:MAG: hypothetical protein KIG50_01215 [Lachnospiraceae bacterium]|nr:hypothetical protein [Lachnospiraceae bacterium]
MAITPLLFNGTVSRMQDVTAIKHNEDAKGMVDQNNFQTSFHREIDSRLNQVHKSDNTENGQKKFDAKDKGDNEYSGDGGKQRHQNGKQTDGRVILKSSNNFDMKV